MDKSCKIGVIMAVYNGEAHILDQINSILWQTYPVSRLIIRDDKSSDETLSIIKQLKGDMYDKIQVITDDLGRIGSAGGNFVRIFHENRLDEFDYIFLADQDDVWLPSKIERAIHQITKTKTDCYASNLLAYQNDSRKSWYIVKDQEQTLYDYLFQGASAGCTYCLNRKAVEIIKENLANKIDLTLNFSHDWLIYSVSRSYGCTWTIDSSVFILYRQHSNNVYGDSGLIVNVLKKTRLLFSGWYKTQILCAVKFSNPSDRQSILIKYIINGSFFVRLSLIGLCFNLRRSKLESVICVLYLLIDPKFKTR